MPHPLAEARVWDGCGTPYAVNGERSTAIVEIDVQAHKRRILRPLASGVQLRRLAPGSRLIWVVVGDRNRIEAGIRELDIGRIVPLDADGNVLADRVDTGTGVVGD